jgi:hypothetical protein
MSTRKFTGVSMIAYVSRLTVSTPECRVEAIRDVWHCCAWVILREEAVGLELILDLVDVGNTVIVALRVGSEMRVDE